MVDIKKGLEGVVVDSTSISLVDGDAGRLYYRGLPIEKLVQHPFAAVAHLVVFGDLPDAARLRQFEDFLWSAGQLPLELAGSIEQLAPIARPSHGDPAGRDALDGVLAARCRNSAAATTNRKHWSRPPDCRPHSPCCWRCAQAVPPRRTRRPAATASASCNCSITASPSEKQVRIFEQTQILQIDHSFNASTFTARVVTSTLAPPASALAAAMGSLYGPLHGAADQGALEMAQEVGDPARAADFVAECLARGRLVMGMGHREYRVVDPRSKIVKTLAEEIAATPDEKRLIETLKAVDEAFVAQTAQKKRSLRANLEFYKGVVYLALGLPKEFFTATFAVARIFGWSAHIVEQRKDNRIVRPSANYIGPAPEPD